MLAIGGRYGSVTVLDALDGKTLASWRDGEKAVVGLSFSPHGGTLATGNVAAHVRLWNVGGWQPVGTLSSGIGPSGLEFSRDGLALVGSDRVSDCIVFDTHLYPEKAYRPWHVP